METAIADLNEYPRSKYSGRGIVICGGGERYFPCVWVCVHMLRYFGCRLPIELWHLGPAEINLELRAHLGLLGVKAIDAYQVARSRPVKRLGGWELKPYAIMHCRFEEVLLIDADNIAVQNPEFLFDSPAYRETGSIFWPDRYPRVQPRPWLNPDIWSICGVPNSLETEVEAGQILLNKSVCWRPLQLCHFFNENSEFYYHYFYGDKDTYQLAWKKMGLPFGLIPHPPKDLHEDWTMAQFDFDGNRLFQHRSGAKWRLHGENIHVPDFYFESECLTFLELLRDRWSGEIRKLPRDYGLAERQVFEIINDMGRFKVTMEHDTETVLSLKPNHTIESNGHGSIGRWALGLDHNDRVVLGVEVCLAERQCAQLTMRANQCWHGYWDQFRDLEAHFVPIDYPAVV
ncbi:MAG: hypothetical protein AAGH88_03420 [Planctomycetota bacterium]